MSDTSMYAPFMRAAIALAERGRWLTCPNPTVGAVLVRDGHVLAEGWHHACGEAHAEVDCLRDAAEKGVDPCGCTLVVTLEPCNHQGKTPPCTDRILEAGIPRVVIGLRDPNPVAAGGAERLRAAGIEVIEGVCEQKCRDLVADFLVWQEKKRPYLLLKLASTLDGRIATRTGHSQWVSCAASRAGVHALRAGIGHAGGAIMVGGGTLRADNPRLTARTDLENATIRQPWACVVTSRLPAVNGDCHLLRERPEQTIFISTPAVAASRLAHELRDLGARVLSVPPLTKGSLDMGSMLAQLYEEIACPCILCEGGGRLALSLLDCGLVDEFHLHLAPRILGDNQAVPLFDGRTPLQLDEALQMRISDLRRCGDDVQIVLRPLG
ncbi:bifunctional diaminohydroxyphosphoribosylaminopyrimidine deaminase/5-amino-6-(5-phosphoribosylamino)uracil reductase RibD [uncultured Desulfovibrio sp.]|uniref:bifunctional diaminohydroxyphosphoribosylaminopyrimidine deaminase/5-amino-6-(5-phosphoribosylamino)uracil reductase RibD n=1 Tax=uncultured Desulfovibrio sp. TaxID=167968 RepID=UPI002610AE6E|nr:bifunctional diaminohydroxyphosphoribosylaminopyrimidine deaminase/5-amino-6-(5-phosphoribosylamino)uracil reductase RibD [uncultured Desulfovibrio sp.]